MKTRFLKVFVPIIALFIITISGFFTYATFTSSSNLAHHDEVNLPIPDDHFQVDGIKWEWNNYIYDVNEEINFTVSRYAKTCGDVFEVQFWNADDSNILWQETAESKCKVDYDELADNDYYSVLVLADFPSDDNPIHLKKEGLYVFQIKSHDSHVLSLGGQIIVKDKTMQSDLSLPTCTSTRETYNDPPTCMNEYWSDYPNYVGELENEN